MTPIIELVDRDIKTVMIVVHLFEKLEERFKMFNRDKDGGERQIKILEMNTRVSKIKKKKYSVSWRISCCRRG